MRLIDIDSIVPGSILGKSIYTGSGKVLLAAGIELTELFIGKLKKMQISHVYIEDELSKDIEIKDAISIKTRLEAKSLVRKILDEKTVNSAGMFNRINDIVNDIIDEILSSGDRLVNLVDIKTKDDYTFSHCVNVAVISTSIGISMGYTRDKLKKLCLGALIHDIGKVKVPSWILKKPDELTKAEYEEIKKHSEYGYKMVKDNNNFTPITKAIVLMHHEKSDGSGYPLGVGYDKIHESVRITAIADVYDAMTSDRVYRRKKNPSVAVEYINAMTFNWFDEVTVEHFRKCVAPYPVGSCVILNTGDVGIVVKINVPTTRPVIKLIKNSEGALYPPDKNINLLEDLTAYIVDNYTL